MNDKYIAMGTVALNTADSGTLSRWINHLYEERKLKLVCSIDRFLIFEKIENEKLKDNETEIS